MYTRNMKNNIYKLIIGFVLGILVTASILIPIIYYEQNKKFILGKEYGKLNGLNTSIKALEKEFGTIDSQVQYKILYSLKTYMVVSVEINGTKTVRVIR